MLGLVCCGTKLFNGFVIILLFKESRTGNEDVCACFCGKTDGVFVDSTVNLDVNGELFFLDNFAKSFYFRHHISHKALSAKAGLNGHNEHHTELIEIGINSLNCCTGFYGKSRNFT